MPLRGDATTRPTIPPGSPTPAATAAPLPTFPLVPANEPTHSPATTRVLSSTSAPLSPLTGTLLPLSSTPLTQAQATAPATDPAHAARPRLRDRIGVAVASGTLDTYAWGAGLPGWYLNWRVDQTPALPQGVKFAQMVRLHEDEFSPESAVVAATARRYSGSLWLIGNEPDVPEQDNVTPLQYARAYHTLYGLIKDADRTAQVAIGGVAQGTPLRMAYLDRILSTYLSLYGEGMPVDVWNVHAFVLREERGSWGVGIPPGFDVDQGTLYEVADHGDEEIFRRQIVDFRGWLASRGQRNKPLIVTEYGILMPEDYGFPPEAVARFMVDSFDFFLNAHDPQIGYPADDNRLVQAFCWFSAGDTMFRTSNLFDPATRTITPLGKRFQEYVVGLEARS